MQFTGIICCVPFGWGRLQHEETYGCVAHICIQLGGHLTGRRAQHLQLFGLLRFKDRCPANATRYQFRIILESRHQA